MGTDAQPTIRDIARMLGLSSATVSRALNDHPHISERTKARVREAAMAVGYVPNAVARSLSLRATRTIGILIPNVAESYLQRMLATLTDLLADRGYTSYICFTEDSLDKEREYLRRLLMRQVDGIVLMPAEAVAGSLQEVQAFQERGRPVICIDRYPEGGNVDLVATDNRAGAYEAVSTLIRMGHRRIGYVHTEPEITTQKERFEGYSAALRDGGLPVDERLVARCGERQEEIGLAVTAMMQLSDPPTALFCRNQHTLVRTVQALKRLGRSVPQDVSVIGFDEPQEALDLVVRASFIRQPAEKIAIHALERLMFRLAAGYRAGETPERIRLAPEIVWRDSCTPPPRR